MPQWRKSQPGTSFWWWDEKGIWDRDGWRDEAFIAVHDYIKENFHVLEEEAPDVIINHRPERK